MSGCRTVLVMFLLYTCLIFIDNAGATEIDISSSFNPVGSGARATGMGSAFIGVADDATAASWNPAGLILLEKPEISAVYSTFRRQQRYESDVNPEMEGPNSMAADGLNYASIAYPFVLYNRNMIISLNYQRLYEMVKEVNYTLNRPGALPGDLTVDHLNVIQDGYLYTVSPAYAVQIIPQLSVGVTLNIWDNIVGKNGWQREDRSELTGTIFGFPVKTSFRQEEDFSFRGTNAHFGLLWSLTDSLTLGGVYKTPFDADVNKETSWVQIVEFTTLPDPPLEDRGSTSEELKYRMPASYGLGLAYRHSDSLTVGLDVYRTEWSRFVVVDEDENESNPLDTKPIEEGRLKDTTQVRLGAEYLFIKEGYAVPARFGIFFDPEPQKGHIDEFYGFSAGTGYSVKRFSLDAAYQFRTGRNLTGDSPNIEDSNSDIKQHTFMISSIFYF